MDDPKTVWEVLAEEADLILGERPPRAGGAVANIAADPEFRALHEDFLLSKTMFQEYARTHQASHRRPDPETYPERAREVEEKNREIERRKRELSDAIGYAQDRVASRYYDLVREHNFSALCLSGGGIRSATFSLGVIEGLALASMDEQGVPSKLLTEVDYLSTVSGGGYIGGWFSSWVKRVGLVQVIRDLCKGRPGKLEPEAAPVSFLREYSNYLNPRLGLTSADTWSLIATYLRNVLLNWVVLLPLIGSVLLLPVCLYALLPLLEKHQWITGEGFWAAGYVLAAVAFAFLCVSLPTVDVQNPQQKIFLWFGLLPASLAGLCFTGGVRLLTSPFAIAWRHYYRTLAPIAAVIVFVSVYAYLRRGAVEWRWAARGLLDFAVVTIIGTSMLYGVTRALPQHWQSSSLRPFVVCAFPAALGLLFAWIAVLVGISSKLTEDEDREWMARAGGWLLLVTVAWLVLAGIGIYGPAWISLIYGAISSAVSGWILSLLGKSSKTPAESKLKDTSSLLPPAIKKREIAVLILLPVFLVLLLMTLSKANGELLSVIQPHDEKLPPALWAVLLLLVVEVVISGAAALCINVNKFSLHGMYRMRLIRAYLGASRPNRTPNFFTGFDPDDNVSMKELGHRPFHVVNMALNLVKGKRLAWQQRKAASFTGTPLHAGSLWWGYRPIKQYSDEEDGMSLGGAITISGAAASPNMGYHSSALLTTIMTLFNARLGAWLGNPGKAHSSSWKRNGPVFGWRSFVDELLGLTKENSKWVYLSDGGHFENLGFYEMVVRRCHTIIVVDGSCDQEYAFEDLANAVRKIRIDLGVPIDFRNGVPIRKADNQTHWAIGIIRYSAADQSDELHDGRLIYIKASLTGDEPADVLQYHRAKKDFPHEATADQWFTESQFESYRALGQHIAQKIAGSEGSTTLDEFVERASASKCKVLARVQNVFSS